MQLYNRTNQKSYNNEKIKSFLLFFLILLQPLFAGQSATLLPSTEGDPDSFIDDCVNVINGDYCETVIDLTIEGPDILYLQRFYNAKNYVTGDRFGSWRVFTSHFMVIGKEKNQKRDLAFTGERSGSILTYSRQHRSKDLFKIDIEQDGRGLVNTFSKNMGGKTNRSNNELYYDGDLCELYLGDGTKRVFEKTSIPTTKILGEELLPVLAEKIETAHYYHLIEEVLPSGNLLLFTYNKENHLSAIELVNNLKNKTISWIHFDYQWSPIE